ncbi:MAG: HNH endonuclease [Verrucomicrobiota bacterium]
MDASVHQSVLVLNRLWQAVNICSARRAFCLLYAGHAHVVDAQGNDFQTFDFQQWKDVSRCYSGEDVARTVSFRIQIPRIIVLLFFDRLPKKEIKLTRHNVFERDQYTCQYCGVEFDRKDLNLDHVIPRDRGGQTTWENIVCSCISCNTKKSNCLPAEAGMKLIRKPKRPKLRTFLNVHISKMPHHSWRHFLDFAYWNVELSD